MSMMLPGLMPRWVALATRFIQGAGNFDGVAQDLPEQQGPVVQVLRQRLALLIYQDERLGTVLLAGVIEHADVGVPQVGDSSGFAAEMVKDLIVQGKLRGRTLR